MTTELNIPQPRLATEEVGHASFLERRLTEENPYETLIPAWHEGPAVRYVDNVSFGPTAGWIIRRQEDLRKIYSDAEYFHKQGNTRFAQMIGEDWDIIPTELDPPRHTAFRQALNPVFSPTNMMKLDQKVRARARHFIEQFKDRGECELVEEFAVNFPISVFLDLVGLPQEGMAQFLEWERSLLHTNDQDLRTRSVRAVKELLIQTIKDKKKNPGDDMISNALTLEVDGRKWTDEEVFGHSFNLFLGGLDTVTSNLSLHFHHLANNPQDQATMRNNTTQQNVVAIEELLRAYAAVSTNRIVSKPYEIGGQILQPGDFVSMSTPLAGRDPEYYENPNEVRLDRKPTHVTLGHGIHRCLGQHLARRELQTAIEEFVKVIPEFHVQPGYKVKFHLGNVIHIPELPLVWH